MKYDSNILYYLDIYKRNWKKMFFLITIAMCITLVVGYIQPVIYKSTVIVLSTQQGQQALNFGGILGLQNISISNSSDEIIFSMLSSRRMMADINEHFNLKTKPRFWWHLDTYKVTGGFAIEIKGPDPDLTQQIANFTVENLDKINSELQITPNKPMVKVLDSALRGVPPQKDIFKNLLISVILSFSLFSFYIFFSDYIKKQKLV